MASSNTKYQQMGVVTATPVVPHASSSSPSATPYLEVISPATLPEGYSFEAEANGKTFQVQVPEGGVKEVKYSPYRLILLHLHIPMVELTITALLLSVVGVMICVTASGMVFLPPNVMECMFLQANSSWSSYGAHEAELVW